MHPGCQFLCALTDPGPLPFLFSPSLFRDHPPTCFAGGLRATWWPPVSPLETAARRHRVSPSLGPWGAKASSLPPTPPPSLLSLRASSRPLGQEGQAEVTQRLPSSAYRENPQGSPTHGPWAGACVSQTLLMVPPPPTPALGLSLSLSAACSRRGPVQTHASPCAPETPSVKQGSETPPSSAAFRY